MNSDVVKCVQQLIQQFGNEYAAAMYVAAEVRRVLQSTDNALSESEAIDWVISGEPADSLDSYIKRHKLATKHRKYDLINEYAAGLDNAQLEHQFRESAIISNKEHRLIIKYGKLDAPDCTRLRILLKQYWLEHLESEIKDKKVLHSS